jgi:serine/threonine protein kinase
VLEGIDHPGILRVKDYKETELGPALIFDHDPKAVRLDHLLRERGKTLTITQRLQMVRDIAETLKYAHAKRCTTAPWGRRASWSTAQTLARCTCA